MENLKDILGDEFIQFSEFILKKGGGRQISLSELTHFKNGDEAFDYLERINYLTGSTKPIFSEGGRKIVRSTISPDLVAELELELGL